MLTVAFHQQVQPDLEMLARLAAHALENLGQQPHPILQRATVPVGAPIELVGPELRDHAGMAVPPVSDRCSAGDAWIEAVLGWGAEVVAQGRPFVVVVE